MDIDKLNKAQLRAQCPAAGIRGWGDWTVERMRKALKGAADSRFYDTPPAHKVAVGGVWADSTFKPYYSGGAGQMLFSRQGKYQSNWNPFLSEFVLPCSQGPETDDLLLHSGCADAGSAKSLDQRRR